MTNRKTLYLVATAVFSVVGVQQVLAQPVLPLNLPSLGSFTSGDLVISTVSLQQSASGASNSGLDTASPITLSELQLGAAR